MRPKRAIEQSAKRNPKEKPRRIARIIAAHSISYLQTCRKLSRCLIVAIEPQTPSAATVVEASTEAWPDDAAPRARDWLVPALLAFVMLLQMLGSIRQLSMTSDEANHLHAGYRYWQCRDFGYNVEHPPLAKLVAALPLRWMAVRDPFPAACGTSPGSDFAMGRQFLFAGDPDHLLTAGRTAVSIFAVGTLLLAWFWTRAMFGRAAATIVATLLAFEPNLLAHGPLVTTDAAVSFGVLASGAALWFCARHPTWIRGIGAGLALGLAIAAKFSAIIAIPILIALLAAEFVMRRGQPRNSLRRAVLLTLVAACVSLAFVWTTYGFRFAARPGAGAVRLTRADWEPAAPHVLPALMKAHVLPEAYVMGLGHVLAQAQTGQPTYLFGHLYGSGRWFYFPAVLLVKLTAPMWLLIVLALAYPWWRGRRQDALYVVLPAVTFLAFAMRSRLDIGVRHVLPLIVFLAIACGAAAASLMTKSRVAKWAVVTLLVLHVATSLHAFPNYISYANELWGGPSGAYRAVTDSNTDWGQALKQVGRRAAGASPCWVLSPYPIPLAYYGVLCRDLRVEPADHIRGTVFVSSTAQSGALALESGYDPGDTFRGRTPSATVGGSAFLVYEGDIDLHTNLSLIYSTTAQVLLAQGRAREAIEYAQHASQLRPDAGTPHYVACAAEAAAGAPDLARHECGEALRLLDRNADFNRRMLDAVRDFMRRNAL
jgi:hypothetical protein